jgi:hypothetical protein
MKHTLHMRARQQRMLVEDLQLDVQLVLLDTRLGITEDTDVVRTIDIDVELPNYPLTQEVVNRLNEKKRIHEYRAWYIVREENGVETHITPEQAARDTAKVEEKSA